VSLVATASFTENVSVPESRTDTLDVGKDQVSWERGMLDKRE